jgi:hypothetical protein
MSGQFSSFEFSVLSYGIAVAGLRIIFCLRAGLNVRVKSRAVNSVFLVQLRKFSAADFRGSTLIKNLVEDAPLSRTEGAGSVVESRFQKKSPADGRRNVHRGCTGNAERQLRGTAEGGCPTSGFGSVSAN